MKTICFVVSSFPAVSETFVTNQILGAKRLGFNVCILTKRLLPLEESTQRDIIESYALLEDTILLDYKIPKSTFKRLFVGFYLILKYFKFWISPVDISFRHRVLNWPYIIRFYKKLRHVDIFHAQFAMDGVAIAEMKANKLLQAKLITTFHGHDAHFKNDKDLIYLQNVYKTLFKVSNFVTVNTPYLENQVLELGCSKAIMHVIPMAIDVQYFKPEQIKALTVNQTVKLISIGRLIEFKGFAYAIEAVKRLVTQGLAVNYTIVGDGVLFAELQDQINALKLQNYITLVGKKSQEEIRSLLGDHHIYLMSSITSAKGRCETQGVVTAEAQAMGLPVVAFNTGGVPYTLLDGETGILVAEKDVDACAQAILEMIRNPKRFQNMSHQAREFAVSNFSRKLMTERFKALYD
ncbi:glycosyltransferase [Bizionia psychrotolerans]|uniref:glycosyltransferase n=1 Tax=Bizionia psychrotolerans TaxID=1492901 RepID=UPI0006509029|nr:glycosyltransferase [Bizionia psychrotolerans]